LIIRNAASDAGIQDVKGLREEGLVSFLAVPLIANGEVLGSLGFLTREEHDFSPDEVGFLSTLAGQAAIAVHHAQLFDQIRQQASELQNANKVKDEFLGVVSHELKTPLNVISGYTNMLLQAMLGELSPIQEKALQTVARQSRELHSLINCVLQVSSIEADMLEPDIHDVNLWEFICELRSSYDYPLDKDVKLVWEVPTDLPTVCTDRGKLKHILENLVNNAIKFTDGGSVTISARYRPGRKIMEFKVSDTGIGISKDQLATIFERFRQVDSSDTRAYGGVGLGLYIVKKYTTLLEGTIQVDSKPGEGSTFTLRIPCQLQKSVSEQPPQPLSTEAHTSSAAV
jgi:signal transduction histidine kinase